VDAVIDLCEGALEIPTELEAVVFFVLEALEFLDQVELEFRAEPRAELEGDVLVGVGAAVAAGTRDETIGSGQVDPLLGREEETVPARLISNSLEFEGIKTGVVDAFPDAEEQDGVLVLERGVKEGSKRGQKEGSVLDIVYSPPSFLRRYKRWFR
jgi:hypothetical protein